MKKILLNSLFLVSLFVSVKTLNAQCSLDQVGAPNYVTTSTLSDMAVAPNGLVYTFAHNSSVNKFQLYAGMTSSTWTLVATITTSTAVRPALAISKAGKISVLIRDENAGKVAKLYYLSGSTFIQQGAAISSGIVSDLSLTFDAAGNEYVAYTDVSNANYSTVKKWASGSSTWVAVGSGIASPGAGYYNSIALDNTDTPLLAFQDATASNKTNVVKFNGASWVSMSVFGVSTTNPKLKIASNNNYYLGYIEVSSGSFVQVFNGTVWNTLGSPVSNLSSSANTFDLDLDPNDAPTFTAILGTPPYPVAYKYIAGSWTQVLGTYLNSSTATSTKIDFDNTGTPYFFYVDQPANSALNVKTISSTISLSSQPISVTRCNGQSGSFSIGIVGGVPNSYQWQVSTAATFTNANTPYTNVTTNSVAFTAASNMNQNKLRCVVDVGCKNIISNTATLTVTTPSVSLVTTNPTCFGGNDGSVFSTPSGGTAPYTYSWSPGGQTTQNITGQYAGNYTVIINDINGCSVSSVGTLTNPPSINTSFTGNQTICNGSTTTLTITASNGVPAYTYSWSPGATLSSTTSSVVTANPTSSQTYNVQVTDANGCVVTNTVMVTVNPLPSVTPGSNVTICNGSSTNLIASGTANTYTWNPGNMIGASQFVTPFTTTTYTVVGTNTVTGCQKSGTTMVTVNPLPTANAGPTRTLTCVNTSTTLSGSGGGTYSWSGPGIVSGGSTANPTINLPGTYSLIVNVAGCSSPVSTVVVSQNTVAPTPGASTSGTLTCITNSVTLTGTPTSSVTYLWSGPGITGSTTTQTTSANAAGSYSLLVTSTVNGCTNTAVTSVAQNTTAPSPTASNTGSLTCGTMTTGLIGSPPTGVNYLWTGPGITGSTSTQSTTANAPGTYTLNVTSTINGCSAIATTAVSQNTTAPSATASSTGTLTCSTLTVALNGGPAGMVYSWTGPGISGSPTTQNTAANAPGIFTLSILNPANGCSASATTAVTQNTIAPSTTASTTGTLTCSTLTVALNGGPAGMVYSWTGPGISGSPTTQNTAANAPGTFTLLVTNSTNGCMATATTAVTQNTTAPSPTASSSNSLSCAITTVSVTGTGGGTYSWSGPGIVSGGATSSAIVNQSGVYTLTVTSANGCSSTASTSVLQNTLAPIANINVSGVLTCTLTSVNASATTTTTPVSFSWSGTGITSATNISTITVNTPGIKNYTVTNIGNGCYTTGTVSVSQNTVAPTLTVSASQTITCAVPTVTITGAATPSTCTPVWTGGVSSGANSFTATASSANTFSLTATDPSNGCSIIKTVIVSPSAGFPNLSAAVVSNSITCVSSTAQAVVTSTTSNITYSWTGPGIVSGAATPSVTVNAGGTYSLAVTNTLSGCTSSTTASVSTDTTVPIVSAGTTGTITCATPSVSLTGNPSTGVTYVWMGPGVTGSATTQNTSANLPGTYSLTVTGTANGCSNTAITSVSQDTVTPSVNAVSNQTITCTATTSTLNALSNADPLSTYLWTSQLAGTLDNYSINNPTAFASGVYTVSVTDSGNGCVASTTVEVFQDITLPTITIGTTASSICSGTSSTLTANGAVSYVWSSGPTSASIVVSPVVSTIYTVTGTGANGCSDIAIQAITVNSTPALSITGNTNICAGSTSNLMAGGATSYTWDSGANTSTISVTPAVTTTYTLTGDNGNGCSSSLMITVSIIPSKNISGVITSTTGATTGDVILYKYVSALSHWDSVTTVPFTSSYSFSAMDSALYVVRAVPSATNIQVTYGDSAISWQDATVITHGCTNNTTQDIKLIALENFILGPGVLTGVITEGNGFVPKTNDEFKPLVPGTPIGGIVVKGGKNPGGQMYVQTTTNAAGQYTLSGLPLNSGGDSYFIFVDIPGLDTNGTYHVIVSNGNSQFDNLNFYVDSMYINPNSITFVHQENIIVDDKITVFPNPARQFVSIQYELLESANVQIELFDIIGNKIETVLNSQQEKNKHSHRINIEQFATGVYFIKMRINNSDNTIKLIITE